MPFALLLFFLEAACSCHRAKGHREAIRRSLSRSNKSKESRSLVISFDASPFVDVHWDPPPARQEIFLRFLLHPLLPPFS
ncbi:uncharacterized protein EV420DRAFT_1561675 [Desarmillaria tabescens]|uniref:Secreted protein n=1 Tax=Armillaria tabescens TaxID=1929756 RepID=A0AA39MY44_ARMTA|nr:uncharacterized protein EV420DRAFT_1561675 [Desarmillaria tabescens]KAK0451246.1 hypothetical protein EV420DRAFT_1561675 [Desarmillaria tabescens]